MIEGESVLDAIAKVRTDKFNDKPYEDVVIESVEVIDEPEKDYPVIR